METETAGDDGEKTQVQDAAEPAAGAVSAATADSEPQPVAEGSGESLPAPESALSPEMLREQRKRALESLLFITDKPLPLEQLCKLVGGTVKERPQVAQLILELKAEMEGRGSALQLLEVADGFQMGTRSTHAPYVRKLFAERLTMKLSTAAHETLAIIAYKQPLTRAEIEEIRGVEVIAALETLLEKRLIKVVGRKETVGRPLMYGTTPDFLRHFGLRSIEDLPPLERFAEAAQAALNRPREQEPLTPAAPADASAPPAPDESAPEASAEGAPQASAETAPEPPSQPEPAPAPLWPTDDDTAR